MASKSVFPRRRASLFFLGILLWSLSPGSPEGSAAWESRPIRLPPLFWYESAPAQERRFLMLSMLYWDYREHSTAHRLLLPVFYRWREEDRTLLVSLPGLVSYRRPDEKWMVAGIFYRHADKEKAQTAVFPLYWQRVRREGGRTTVALPFLFYDYRSRDRTKLDQATVLGWRRRRGDAFSGMLLNYWWAKDPKGRFWTVFPFLWHTKSPEERFDVLGPFYYRRVTISPFSPPAASTGTASEAAPSATVRKNVGLFPLIGAGWGRNTASSYLFPLYYVSRSPEKRAWATLPVSSFRSGDSRKGHVGLYFFSHDPDLRLDGIFPLGYRRRSTDGFESSTQVLNYYYRRENEDSFQTFFPLYGFWSSPEGKRLLSWGVFWKGSPEVSSGWAYLYYWKRERPVPSATGTSSARDDTTRIFFPLYWHFWREPDWGLDLFFPLYTRYRNSTTTVTAVPPFIWRKSGDRLTWSFLALYWHDKSASEGFTTAVPFFHSQYNPQRRMWLSPISWIRRSAASREGIVPPVYWYKSAESRRLLVFPLYWKSAKADKSLNIIPPYYRWRREDRLSYGIFPLWGRHRGTDEGGGHLFPFYWYNRAKSGDGQWIIPLTLTYVSRKDTGTEKEKLHVQYLLLGSYQREAKLLSHEFFPLYKYVRQPDFANFWAPRVIALTAWERRKDVRKGYVFPYAWRRGPDRDWDLFLPLWYRSRTYEVSGDTETKRVRGESTGGATVFFPLYWSGANPERKYRAFVPLYFHYGEKIRRFDTVIPLWVSYDAASGNKFRLFFPLYWRFLFKGAPAAQPGTEAKVVRKPDRDISVFGPWYRIDTKREGLKSRTVGLAPLFSFGSDDADSAFWEVLGGLVGRDRREGKARYRILYFFYTKPRPVSH